MKKPYESPRAQKLAFDYTNVVVASGGSQTGNGNGCAYGGGGQVWSPHSGHASGSGNNGKGDTVKGGYNG